MYEYKVKEIVKVYDADTITVIVDLGFNVSVKEVFRLVGINAPEVRGDEREEGLIARDWLRERVFTAYETDCEIIIKTQKDRKGKYGRWLGELFIDGININEQLIAEGYAVEYMK